jgi:hypothetical protein
VNDLSSQTPPASCPADDEDAARVDRQRAPADRRLAGEGALRAEAKLYG